VIANSSLAHDEETTLAKKHGRDKAYSSAWQRKNSAWLRMKLPTFFRRLHP
jgi:hypothetical protein